MDFRLLGPLEVVGDGGLGLQIGAGRQRALLALLLLRANEPVTSDRLVEELWGASPPPTAHKMLHNQVSALRHALGRNGRLETRGSAYRLNVGPDELDLDRFEALVATGRARIGADPEGAAGAFREALGLWRGPPLSDLADEPFAQIEIARLEERRWAAFEARVDADLALGRHADLVSELEVAVTEEPFRERLHGQLMLALYRCGRQAEALEAYRTVRRTLVDQIGIEPGAELRELEGAILAQDPALAASEPSGALPPALAGGSPVLVGRESELATLTALLTDAGEGRGGLVLITGAHGSGKTRLAAELAREALRRGMAVLHLDADTPPGEALAALDRAEARERPALVIVDDVEVAGREVLDRVAALAGDVRHRPLLLVVLGRRPSRASALEQADGRRLALGPLGDEAVAAIARLYDPAGTEPLPIAALAARSAGVPLAVHRAAAELARARAAEVIGDSAGRAAAERGELRAAEADLSSDLLDLGIAEERGRLYGAEEDRAPVAAVCPYVGLATFDAAHARYFYGRERLVADLVARLVGSRLLAVIGPSGSGKSSVGPGGPAAGARDRCAARQRALAAGRDPSGRASAGRARAGADRIAGAGAGRARRRSVRGDVHGRAATRDERTAFLDALAAMPSGPTTVSARRARHAGGLLRALRRASPARAAGRGEPGARRADATATSFARAIELPARRAGLRVEPELVDAAGRRRRRRPGGLPLLSTALLELLAGARGPR